MSKQQRIVSKNIFQYSEDEELNFSPPEEFRAQAYFQTYNQYNKFYRFSVEDRKSFGATLLKNCIGSNHGIKSNRGRRLAQIGLSVQKPTLHIIVLMFILMLNEETRLQLSGKVKMEKQKFTLTSFCLHMYATFPMH
jgi:hypothetical protein